MPQLTRRTAPARRGRLRLVVLTLLPLAVVAVGSAAAAQESPSPTAAASPTATATGDGEEAPPIVVQGTLQNEAGPVPDVTITAADAQGSEVGSAVTGADGGWMIELPSPGSYTVTLDVATLPPDVALTDPDRAALEIDVRPGLPRFLNFSLGEGSGGRRLFNALADAAVNGLQFGLLIAMAAIGLSLIFGTTGLINFAHGELVVIGAVVAHILSVGGAELPLIVAAAIAIVAAAALGAVLDLGLFRPLRQRRVGLFQLLIITIGLSLALRFVVLIVFGGTPSPYDEFIGQTSLVFGPIRIVPRGLIVIVLSVVVLVAVATALQRTRVGKAMRAVADNRDLAESSGIDVQRIILYVWVGGTALAALGGIFYGVVLTVDYLFGFRLLLLMFAGIILGGLGTAYGAMLGSIVVGLVTELSTVWFPNELKYMWGLAILVIVLLVRPQGLLGARERIG